MERDDERMAECLEKLRVSLGEDGAASAVSIVKIAAARPGTRAMHVSNTLNRAFSHIGGRKALYAALGDGPVAVSCAAAGIPEFPGTRDPSFGSVL